MKQRHLFHLVNNSPYPITTSFTLLLFTSSLTLYMHNYSYSGFLLLISFLLLLINLFYWWNDIVIEGTFVGDHTSLVQKGLRYGVIFFIISEVMFFASIFWAYFTSSMCPTIEIGSIWPPVGLEAIPFDGIPLLNTILLLTSGCTLTIAHYGLINNNRYLVIITMIITILLALYFTYLQYEEFVESRFSISDGVYGSTFFLATGCHGLHVIIGTLFILVALIRHLYYHFTKTHHLGFESAAWYWHFVDVVWLFLYVAIYWWGSC